MIYITADGRCYVAKGVTEDARHTLMPEYGDRLFRVDIYDYVEIKGESVDKALRKAREMMEGKR